MSDELTEVVVWGLAYEFGDIQQSASAVVIREGHPVIALGTSCIQGGVPFESATVHTPGQARELAFALLDAAQVVELREGTFDPDHDPFESTDPFESALIAQQQLPYPL